MSDATQVLEAVFGAFPREDAVAALRDNTLRGELEVLEEHAWPDFDVAMVGPTETARTEWHGLDGLVAAWRDWLGGFDSHRTEIVELRDGGDCAVMFIRQFARPKGGLAEVENSGAVALWVRDGKLSRIEFHIDRRLALEATGLGGE